MGIKIKTSFGVIALLCGLFCGSLAQAEPQRELSEVPFVGCKSDGQTGPVAAPRESSKTISLDKTAAEKLAYYKAETTMGVLAPRGWYCFGVYGSSGSTLFITPEPINTDDLFSSKHGGIKGAAVQIRGTSGDTSGRFTVARIMARVFPKYKSFVQRVIDEKLEPASDFPSGPYSTDKFVHRSDEAVEYQTPAHGEGLGTKETELVPNDLPVNGVAILTGAVPDLTFLAVRLPGNMTEISQAIIQQIETESSVSPSP